MTNGQVTVQEHLEKLFAEFVKRYESERKSDQDLFDQFKNNLDGESKLLAESYMKDLRAYPTVADFNELKDKVTNEFGTAVGKAKAFAIGLGLLAVTISGAGVMFAMLK